MSDIGFSLKEIYEANSIISSEDFHGSILSRGSCSHIADVLTCRRLVRMLFSTQYYTLLLTDGWFCSLAISSHSPVPVEELTWPTQLQAGPDWCEANASPPASNRSGWPELDASRWSVCHALLEMVPLSFKDAWRGDILFSSGSVRGAAAARWPPAWGWCKACLSHPVLKLAPPLDFLLWKEWLPSLSLRQAPVK